MGVLPRTNRLIRTESVYSRILQDCRMYLTPGLPRLVFQNAPLRRAVLLPGLHTQHPILPQLPPPLLPLPLCTWHLLPARLSRHQGRAAALQLGEPHLPPLQGGRAVAGASGSAGAPGRHAWKVLQGEVAGVLCITIQVSLFLLRKYISFHTGSNTMNFSNFSSGYLHHICPTCSCKT